MSPVTLVRLYTTLFAVSTAFPIAASLMPPDAISRTIGLLDIGVALVLLATAMYVVSRKAPGGPDTASRAVAWYKVSGTLPIALAAIFFVAGSHVDWLNRGDE